MSINETLFSSNKDKKKSRSFTLQSVDDFLASGGKIQSIANGISGYTPISTKQQQRGGRK